MKPDFFELARIPGYFGSRNDAAGWLQEHKDDPYWMAHQLYDFHRGDDFNEIWKMAREIKGYDSGQQS